VTGKTIPEAALVVALAAELSDEQLKTLVQDELLQQNRRNKNRKTAVRVSIVANTKKKA
jgi:hypothetical protein